MNPKIQLKICMGTMCYVMGGADLKGMVEALPLDVKKHVDVSFSPCLGCCNEKQDPPYVELNGRIVPGVTRANLLQIIKEEIKNVVR